MTTSSRKLALLLRLFGMVDLLATIAVLLPKECIAAVHAWVGLGTLPEGAVVGYLARSASAMYVLHGVMLIFVSFDVERYRRLIAFLAIAALAHGGVILIVDLWEKMPPLWTLLEGPGFAATGLAVLWMLKGRNSVRPMAPQAIKNPDLNSAESLPLGQVLKEKSDG